MSILCEKHGMCSKSGVWQGAGNHLSCRCVPTEPLGLGLFYLTKLHGMVLSPTCWDGCGGVGWDGVGWDGVR